MNDNHTVERQTAISKRVKSQRKQIRHLQQRLESARHESALWRHRCVEAQLNRSFTVASSDTRPDDIGGLIGFVIGILLTVAIWGWVV
jgi:hypothetical protein